MSDKPAWLIEAEKHIGLAEIPGVTHQPLILRMWKAIKRGGIQSDEVPWCAAFVGFCFESIGIVSSRYESAKSYLAWGQGLELPKLGCVAVFERTGGGHVGFVVGRDQAGRLMVLGGNQGNRVSVAPFDASRPVVFRWPAQVLVPELAALPVIASTALASSNEA